jgi:hypothetical protein
MSRLLTDSTPETGAALLEALEAFRPWPLPPAETLSVFVRDNELAWLTGTCRPGSPDGRWPVRRGQGSCGQAVRLRPADPARPELPLLEPQRRHRP